MRRTKGFSYDIDKDKDVINHIDEQQNGSQYIWQLVRKDMKETNIIDVINNQIEKYLRNSEIKYSEIKCKKDFSTTTELDINEDEIKNILGM